LPSIDKRADVELAAVADSLPAACDEVATQHGARVFPDIASLVAGDDVEAVYIATPTDLHVEHVMTALAAGKHVLVEKPMAIDLAGAKAMVEAAERAGLLLMVGHSHSYDLPYRRMRDLVNEGRLGRVRMMHNIYYTDWLYRPRRPEELKTELGGGVTFRQGAHQFDILRLVGGGLVRKVRAVTFDWDPQRSAIGAHCAWLTFEDGTVATAVYNGYGAFLSSEICYDVGELGSPQGVELAGAARRAFRTRTPGDELAAKRTRAGGLRDDEMAPNQPFFGWMVVSCEGGDIRQSPTGLYIYSERGREELPVPLDRSTRDVMLEEFFDAVSGARSPLHDGRWGMANLEVCVAAIESARTDRDVELKYQVPPREVA
jgi:phthalate 4,5-cis-dihydrodiol dehydrogenase